MIKDYQSLLSLPIGTLLQWPEVTGDEVLILEEITQAEIIFDGQGDSLGIEIPLEKLHNYPRLVNFQNKTNVQAPFYIYKGDVNGQNERRQANG